MKLKFILTSAISAVILTHSLFAASHCVAFADDNENSYTVVVSNEDLSDDWKSDVNFYYDLIWNICGDDISCQSTDNIIHFDAKIRDDTLYVDGTDFLFAICEIPNIFDEEDESCGAMLDWVLKLQGVRNIVFSDSVETLEMLGSTVFFARIENIEFGNSFKRIGKDSMGITKIKNMEFPESLKEIGESAFRSCRHLEKIVLPSGIEKIGENAFYGCSELKDITVLSKDVELSNSGIGYSHSGELLTDVIIHGYSGSTAETYANENNFEFVPLDEEPATTTTSATSTSIETTTITTTIETSTTSTSAEVTSQNTSENTSATSSSTTTATTTSPSKTDSPKTGDKGIIGASAALLSALGMLFISKKKRQ